MFGSAFQSTKFTTQKTQQESANHHELPHQDGKVLWEEYEQCTGCNGTGVVGSPATQTHDAEYEKCPFCDGEGFTEVEKT